MVTADVLIIGSGIAGLTFALKTANANPDSDIIIITKSDESESNTKYAQGGIAVVVDENDSFENHIQDTLTAGDGLCDLEVVQEVIQNAPKRLQELIDWGANFDKELNNDLQLGKEGGHGKNRIVHHKDITGFEIEQKLLRQINEAKNIQLLPHHFAIDLITEHHIGKYTDKEHLTCFGAYVLNEKTNKIDRYISKVTMLASGGIGQVYAHTTNPAIATGDGIGMAYRAKAYIRDMEFVQFHPTALYDLEESPSFLISEAVRGEGAYLRNHKGNRFMFDYDDRLELASRDIVSQAIDNELKKSGKSHVYLDCKHIDLALFIRHFPNIYAKCLSKGIDIEKDMIPVVPAAHYLCGGIKVNLKGQTTIANLYACGECTGTGLHGANRLASNSLLEALVFAENSSKTVTQVLATITLNTAIPQWDERGVVTPKELILLSHNKKELRAIMSDFVGIVRSEERLKISLKRLKNLYEEVEELYASKKLSIQLCELRNMINVSYLIITQSIKRKENRGAYFNSDLVK